MPHLYEVTTSSGSHIIINAANSMEAKKEVCKQLGFNLRVSPIEVKRISIDFPEVNYRPSEKEEALQQYVGKDIVIYDEHHGTATRIKKSTVASLQYYLDEYSTIIVLE